MHSYDNLIILGDAGEKSMKPNQTTKGNYYYTIAAVRT